MGSETTGSGGTSGVRIVTRKSLFDKMKNENLRNLEEKLCFLKDHLFTQDNLTESNFEIPVTTTNCQGRPHKSFGESSERSKRSKTEEIRSNVEDGVIVYVAQEGDTLKLLCKWGCDGSQQVQYKQKHDNEAVSDANIFQSCFVRLKCVVRLTCGKDNQKVLWENLTPSSARFYRLIRFRFVKVTTDITNEEINYVENSIDNLVATEVNIDGKKILVHSQFVMTMVDGKAASGTTSTSRCYICGKTSKEFNNLKDKRRIPKDATEFGLSILHARIRFFESILHLA
ncbi:hypothetical protein ACJJTC_009162 [Scirpophaga incertulas]